MWWQITTTWATLNLRRCLLLGLAVGVSIISARGQDLRVPTSVVAGSEAAVTTDGTGDATFYLLGPASALKETLPLGEAVRLQPENLAAAGRYVAIVCQETCRTHEFFVVPAKVSSLSLLVHPSRAAVGQPDVLSGVALPFDANRNLVLKGVTVDFHLGVNGQDITTRSISVENGAAWFRTNSGSRAGAVQVVASAGEVSARRVVQQVASDPCHLQVKAGRDAKGIAIETDPVRDCAGNPVPDGTMVTFRGTSPDGVSTVDAPIKQGVARARMIATGPIVISVASGVAMGNQVRVEAQR